MYNLLDGDGKHIMGQIYITLAVDHNYTRLEGRCSLVCVGSRFKFI